MLSLPEPTVSVVIPVHNGGENFHRCLAGVSNLSTAPLEVIVVIDGESQNSSDAQQAERLGARIVQLPINRGPACARNAGAKIAQGDILFFMDADVVPHPTVIAQVQQAFQHDPNLAALIGSYDDAPGQENFLSQYRNLLHHYVHQTGSENASTFWGACGAIRRSLFLTIGGFDERYPKPSIEDIELGYRLKRAGYRIRLCKQIQVKHLKHWGAESILKTDFFCRALPWTELIYRDRQFVNDLNLQTSNRISVVLVYGLVCSLVLSLVWSTAWIVSAIAAVFLTLLNLSVYRFFARKRGWKFAIATIPWHWLYYGYSGLAFAIGTIRHHSRNVIKAGKSRLSQAS
ncbi:glycosyl transferase family 2 [Leptolyngbya sp. NIES-3755]|nr:glycosyl transferase family 2 [Leptolyngbya sp. NIES-3755]